MQNHVKKNIDEENVSDTGTDSDVPSELSSPGEVPNHFENDVDIETEMVYEIDFRPLRSSSPIPFDETISDAECSGDSLSISSSVSLSEDELYQGAGIHVQDFKAEFLRIGTVHRMSDSFFTFRRGIASWQSLSNVTQSHEV